MLLKPHSAFTMVVSLLSFVLCLFAQAADSLKLAEAAAEDSLWDLAEQHALECLRDSDPQSPRYYKALSICFQAFRARNNHKAILDLIAQIKKPDTKSENRAMLRFWKAVALNGLDHNEEALSELYQGFPKDDTSTEYSPLARRLRASVLTEMGRLEEAIAELESFDKDFHSTTDAPANKIEWAELLRRVDRNEEALSVLAPLANQLATNEIVARARCMSAEILAKKGRTEDASTMLFSVATNLSFAGDIRAEAFYTLANVITNSEAALAALSNGVACSSSPAIKRRGNYLTIIRALRSTPTDEAVRSARSFVALNPNDAQSQEVQLLLATSLLQSGRAQDAELEYLRYQESYTNAPGLACAFEGRGWALLALNRSAEAASEFLKAASVATGDVEKVRCLLKAADSYFANAQYTLAIQLYDQLANEHANSSEGGRAALQAAEAVLKSGDSDGALRRFVKVSENSSDPELTAEALVRIAEIRQALGSYREALTIFDTIILQGGSNSPLSPRVLHGRAMALYRLFRFSEAKDAFERLLKTHPDHPLSEQAFYMRGLCDFALGRDESALTICEDFLVRHPSSQWAPEIMFWMGRYYYNAGSYQKAEDTFLRLAEQDPPGRLADSSLLLAGLSASKNKEYLRAIAHLNKFVKQYPQSRLIPDTRFAQAEAMIELADLSGAILVLDEIIVNHPQSHIVPLAWGRKGDCQFTLGEKNPKRYEEAIESYRVVCSIPDIRYDLAMQAEYKIGRCLEKMGKTDAALRQYYDRVVVPYLEALEKGRWPNEASKTWFTRAAFSAADILEARKEWESAVSVLNRVIEADVPAAREAKERIERIKSGNWWNMLNGGV